MEMGMKVLHAIPVYAPAWQFGGPVLSVSRLCEGLAVSGVDVTVLTTNAGLSSSDVSMHCWENGIQVYRFPIDHLRGRIRSTLLVRALPDLMSQADLVHLSGIWQPLGLDVQKAAIDHQIPVLHSLRGALGPYSFRHGWWKKIPYYWLKERPLLDRAAGLHVTSQQELSELEHLRLTARAYILPNPMDLKMLYPDETKRQHYRKELGIKSRESLLLICGRQHHKKGLDLLPEILDACKNHYWRLLIIGSDEDGSGKALQTALKQRGLGQRVLYRSTLPAEQLGGIYNAADLLLLPSRHENFGNVVIEALACRCAVAISDQTGVATDLLHNAPNGYGVVLPRLRHPWEGWLSRWLARPERATPEVAAWVAGRYSQRAVATQAIEIYDEILQTRSL